MKYTCIESFYYAQINKEKIIHRSNKLFMETISMNWLYYMEQLQQDNMYYLKVLRIHYRKRISNKISY